MSATATEVQHTPWCNDHSSPTPDMPGSTDLCSWERHLGGQYFVNIEEGGGRGGAPVVGVWGRGDEMTTREAGEMAAAIVEATSIASGHDTTTTRVLRNLTAALAAQGPLPVDDIERLAELLGIDVVDVFRAGADA